MKDILEHIEKVRMYMLRDNIKANTTTHEFGKEDNKVYCYGLYQNNISGFGEWIADCCRKCKAFVENVEDKSE